MKLPNPKLSARMKSFIEHALKGQPFWDVCCDHGYVGIKALESSEFLEVHFVDQVPHIMQRLETLIKQSWRIKPEHKYFLYLLPGEEIEGEVHGTLLIAGVGGLTIKTIVSTLISNQKLKASRLLLSPHTDEKVLIQYLDDEVFKNLYTLTDKILMPEGKRFRPLYIFDLKQQRPEGPR